MDNENKNNWRPIIWLAFFLLWVILFFIALLGDAGGQNRSLKDIEITSPVSSYIYVVSGSDSVSRHNDLHKAVESWAAELLANPWATIYITQTRRWIPKATVVFQEPTETQTALRNIHYAVEEDSLPGWKLRLKGESDADSIAITTRCIGTDTLTTHTLRVIPLEGTFEAVTTEICNQVVIYTATAWRNTEEWLKKGFVDYQFITTLQ